MNEMKLYKKRLGRIYKGNKMHRNLFFVLFRGKGGPGDWKIGVRREGDVWG